MSKETLNRIARLHLELEQANESLGQAKKKESAKKARNNKVERNEYGRTEFQEQKKTARRNAARFSTETLAAFLSAEYGIEFSGFDYYRGKVKRKAVDFYAERLPCQRCRNAGVSVKKGDSFRSRSNHWDHLVPVGGAFRGAIEELPKRVWDSPEMVSLLCFRCNSEKGKLFDYPLSQLIAAFVRNRIGKAERLAEIERHIKRVRKWIAETPKHPDGA